jgi:ABC-2 type transport system permease protein
MSGLINLDAILATWKRQLWTLLGNPLGYVFILAFVVGAAGFLVWPDGYFSRNIADFGPLLPIMPWLLVVLLPALGMGSWATERELGTEEQLLTLPMSVFDVLLGKWLGVVSYFTVALIFSLFLVRRVCDLGHPDLGLLFANYAGWWFAGLVFAAVSVFASTLVALPAIAFVLGTVFCGGLMTVAYTTEWFDPFNRGVIPIGGVFTALVLVSLFLGLASLVLSMRRWQPVRRPTIVAQCVVFIAVAITMFNLSIQTDRAAVDKDVTSEQLSSLSSASYKVIEEIKEPVTITAFISQKLPPEMALKGREVENKLKVLSRSSDMIRLEIHHPSDSLDEAGVLASQHYNLKPQKVMIDTVAGKDLEDVFLGAVVRSGSRRQRIDHFDPGLSVEYELVRALRTVSSPKKKVIGIAVTDLKMMGSVDRMMGARPEWEIIGEWRKQYDVREVNLDVPVGDDVEILVAPQSSSLTDAQMVRLHDFIWSGRPTLMLEDPFPYSQPDAASSQPRTPPNPMMGMPPQNQAPKGDMKPLLKALGLEMDLAQVLWSDYNPSHHLRKQFPPSFIWLARDTNGILESASTTGINSMLTLLPGGVKEAVDKSPELTIKPLLKPVEGSAWGHHSYMQYSRGIPERFDRSVDSPPNIAVEITGKMKRAYPFDKPDEPPTPEGQPKPPSPDAQKGVGELSAKPIRVIFVADVDLISDVFFSLYRGRDPNLSRDDLKVLRDLRNVQFAGNAMDALAEDKAFLELRTRQPQSRPLEKLEKVVQSTQLSVRQAEDDAEADAEKAIGAARKNFDEKLQKIREQKDLDEVARMQKLNQITNSAQRQLDAEMAEAKLVQDQKVREAKVAQQREVEKERASVRLLAFLEPSIVLLCLALGVFGYKRRGERLNVPASRQRSGV